MSPELEGPPEPSVSACGCVWIRVSTPEYTGDRIAQQCADHAAHRLTRPPIQPRQPTEYELLQFERYVRRELDRELDDVLRGRR